MLTKSDCGNPAVMFTTDELCLFTKLNTSQVNPYWTFLCVWTSVNTMFLERRETSSVVQYRKCWRKCIGSFVQLRSCCAYTQLSCARRSLSRAGKLDEHHVPKGKSASFFVCGLPHLYSMRVSIPAALGVVWLVLTQLDISRLTPSTLPQPHGLPCGHAVSCNV